MDNHIITKFSSVVPYAYDYESETTTFEEVTQQSVEYSYKTRT